jgi:GDPmannose 4,6-dehydratase
MLDGKAAGGAAGRKTALITGVSGQDGAYLARLLLNKGYRVVGAVRRTSASATARLEELGVREDVELVDLDLFEFSNVLRVVEQVAPDEIYNLAAQSFVHVSFQQPLFTSEIDALGVTRLLEAVRCVNPKIGFYQASTSEMFGKVVQTPQNEATPFHPRSPYAVAKLYGHWIAVNYRESYNLNISCGLLFNHESPLRGQEFVTRKITRGLALVKHGKLDQVRMGNLAAQRDWGYAEEYVDGMWRMLQKGTGDSYVLATGKMTTIKQFVEYAAPAFDMVVEWTGKGVDEKGIDLKTGRTVLSVDPKFFRPAEVDMLVGDSSKARSELGWVSKTSVDRLAMMMAEADDRRVYDNRSFF